jgi:hypothetical protein
MSEKREAKRLKVNLLMEKAKKIATPLFTVAKLLKTQEKLGPSKIIELKESLARFYQNWLRLFPATDQHMFPKLHHLLAHILSFIIKYGLYGRISEEGFESFHTKFNAEKKILQAMGHNKQRVNTLSRRLQLNMKKEVQETLKTFETNKTTTKNRPTSYKVKNSATRMNDNQEVETSDLELLNGTYVFTQSNGVIKEKWIEVYDLCVRGRVPSSWCKRVDCYAKSIGILTQEKAKFIDG